MPRQAVGRAPTGQSSGSLRIVPPPSTYLPISTSPGVRGVLSPGPGRPGSPCAVPVAPGLAHEPAWRAAQRGVAARVDHQAVGQAVGVLVEDDAGESSPELPASERGPVRTGTSACGGGMPSGRVLMFALSRWSLSGMPVGDVRPVHRLAAAPRRRRPPRSCRPPRGEAEWLLPPDSCGRRC